MSAAVNTAVSLDVTTVITLASGSPRRRELLERVGYTLRVAPADIDETPLPGEDPVDYARRLAREKAGPGERADEGVVVAADTVVHRGGDIFHKPTDAADAVRILTALSDSEHFVTTGVCVRRGDEARVRAVTTTVRFAPLSPALIQSYVATGEPMDKAGAYGIQGIGAVLVRSISGSYTNVVGLPLAEVVEDLIALGASPTLLETM